MYRWALRVTNTNGPFSIIICFYTSEKLFRPSVRHKNFLLGHIFEKY